jgi:hypothetical protein
MNLYCLRRRAIAAGANALDEAFTRLRAFEEAPRLPVRWLHSYALREADGRFGLLCVFEAADADALREHALATQLPAEETVRVVGRPAARAFTPSQAHLVRRPGGWADAAGFAQALAGAQSIANAEGPAHRLSWLHSYAVHEDGGRVGSFCLYQTPDTAALADHAQRAGLPATEILPVLGRVVCRESPALSLPAMWT